MLLTRKDECNRNIRDLGVLPEEAFEKYTNDKLDRVRVLTVPHAFAFSLLGFHCSSSRNYITSTRVSRNSPTSIRRLSNNTTTSRNSGINFFSVEKTWTSPPNLSKNLLKSWINGRTKQSNEPSSKLPATSKKCLRSSSQRAVDVSSSNEESIKMKKMLKKSMRPNRIVLTTIQVSLLR